MTRWSWDSIDGLSFALDGTDVGTLTYDGAFVVGDDSPQLTIGGLGNGNGARDWTGWIAEVLIYNVKLSPSDANIVSLYLKNKYATP